MKIFLLSEQPYPIGFALTRRFHYYCKGFIHHGHEAKVIMPFPTEKGNNPLNTLTEGIFDGVAFRYAWKTTTRSQSFIRRRYHDFAGIVNTGKILISEKPDVVITSVFSLRFYLFLKLLSFFWRFRLIQEKNEVDYYKLDHVSKLQKLKSSIISKLFDGFIVINRQLKSYLSDVLKVKKGAVIIPVLMKSYPLPALAVREKTIVYTGTFYERKDGILTALKAFNQFRVKYPDYRFMLSGDSKALPDKAAFKKIIEEGGSQRHVVFTGYLPDEQYHRLLQSAGILILTKPDNRQNEFNFPTKIGEYLMTGRPVLATRVGVVGELLTDGTNVFFADFDTHAIAEKMQFIVEHPELAEKVGSNGRAFAESNFDYLKHTKRLTDFLGKL